MKIRGKSSKQSCLLGVLYQYNFDLSAEKEWLQKCDFTLETLLLQETSTLT